MNLVELTCMWCKETFQGEEPEMCCNGRECGCRGLLINPIVCSEECFNRLLEPKPQTILHFIEPIYTTNEGDNNL